MNIYDCDLIIREIEAKAYNEDGEVNDEDMQAIVEAKTSSIEQLGKLIGYIKYLEGFSEMAKKEIQRVQERKKTADNRISSIKKFLLPYVQEKGSITVGTNKLGTRKSKGVVLADGFNHPEYCKKVVTFKPDKKKIKEDIENGIEVKGAVLEERTNLSIR